MTAGEDSLLLTEGEVFSSTSSAADPAYAHNFYIGSSDGQNGCWAPDPPTATPEYVGVRFTVPITVTGFQFASGVYSSAKAPYGVGPCAYPTAFRLEASNDETNWTPLLDISNFTGMRVATQSIFSAEGSSWWDGGVSLSDRLDVSNDHAYLAYRMDTACQYTFSGVNAWTLHNGRTGADIGAYRMQIQRLEIERE